MENASVDLSTMVLDPDAPDVVLASPDFYEPERPLPSPGRYYSPNRTIQVKPHKDWDTGQIDSANWDFTVDFGKDSSDVPGGKSIFGIPRAYLNTLPRKSFRGMGEASTVVRYLTACGFENVHALSAVDLFSLLRESENRPVYFKVEWQDNYKERPEGEKASYTNAFKLKDGEDGKPVYAPRVTLQDGRVITANAKVGDFISVTKVKV